MGKKILITASTFPRWKDDTEPRFILDYAKAMTKYYEVHVMVPMAPGAKEEENMEGVMVHRFHYFPIHRFETLCYPGAIVPRIKEKKIRAILVPFLFIGLWNALRKSINDYDCVHAHWLIPQGIVQSFFKKPYMVTGHGGDVTSLNKGIIKKLKTRCIKKAECVTAVSEYLKERILELVPGTNVEVISMGVDTSLFGPQYRVDNYFGQCDKKVVLFVGRLAEKKGVTYLIEAMKNIDAMLVIAGDGPLRRELEVQAYTQSLSQSRDTEFRKDLNKSNWKRFGNILFIGSKTHQELKTVYASADIFCLPSITAMDGDQEGFPLVMLEAMASGLPVVASRSGGIPQLIQDGKNGLLCEEKNTSELAEKIMLILSDSFQYQSIVKESKKQVEDYSYLRISNFYSKLFDNICHE